LHKTVLAATLFVAAKTFVLVNIVTATKILANML